MEQSFIITGTDRRAPRPPRFALPPLSAVRGVPSRPGREPFLPPAHFDGSAAGLVPAGWRELRFSDRYENDAIIERFVIRWALNTQNTLHVRFWVCRSTSQRQIAANQFVPSAPLVPLIGENGTVGYIRGDEGQLSYEFGKFVKAPFYLCADADNTDSAAHTLDASAFLSPVRR